jgi:hypothetical protein
MTKKGTYIAVVREAKAMQVGNANIGALSLHPHIGSHFTTQLLVHCAGVFGFGELLWHGVAEDEVSVRADRLSRYLDGYTDIEGASNPLLGREDCVCLSITEP